MNKETCDLILNMLSDDVYEKRTLLLSTIEKTSDEFDCEIYVRGYRKAVRVLEDFKQWMFQQDWEDEE